MVVEHLKELVSIKIKSRHDGYTDQVSRIIVTKMFVLSSIVLGVDWFQDNMICLPPAADVFPLPSDFITKSCWVKGVYVYPFMENHMKMSGYYGIPLYLNIDGVRNNTKPTDFCHTTEKLYRKKENCIPMVKEYFTQYQWMPFYIASLSVAFYFPYFIFRVVNTDMTSLRHNLKNPQVDADGFVENYFNRDLNPAKKNRFRVCMNFVIKCLYVFFNITSFLILNRLLNYRFRSYGMEWIAWAKQNSTLSSDFSIREKPTPGNKMLPTFALCELHDARLDGVRSYVNKAVMICEMSSHILYQYVFLVIWVMLVISISISVFGVFLYLAGYVRLIVSVRTRNYKLRHVYKFLTFREWEYLEFIRVRDMYMYGSIIQKLRERTNVDLEGALMKHCDKVSGVATFYPPSAPLPKIAETSDGGSTKSKRHVLKHLVSVQSDT